MASGKTAITIAQSMFASDFKDGEFPVWYDGMSIVVTNMRVLEYQGIVKLKLAFEIEVQEIASTEYKYNLKEYGIKLILKSGENHLIKNKMKPQFNGLNEALDEVRSGATANSFQLAEQVKAEASNAALLKEERELQKTEKFAADTNWTKPLPKWVIDAISTNRISDEPVKLILMGSVAYAGALIAFEDRCIIAKGGAMGSFMAGSLGGGRVTTFYFDQITGIEYNAGLLSGVLEILTPSYQGTANKDFWKGIHSGGKQNLDDNDPWKLSNTLPLARADYQSAKPLIDSLRKLISEFRRGGPSVKPTFSQGTDLSEELLKLSELRDKGILTEEEFTSAKAKLLGN